MTPVAIIDQISRSLLLVLADGVPRLAFAVPECFMDARYLLVGVGVYATYNF